MIDIRSTVNEMQSFELSHRPVCIALGRCQCDPVSRSPQSLILPPFGYVRNLDEAVLTAPSISAALVAKRPTIHVKRVPGPGVTVKPAEMRPVTRKGKAEK